MIDINDIVMYSTSGACRVTEICEKVFDKKSVRYFVLVPLNDEKSTIYCPVEHEEKLKKPISRETAEELIENISKLDCPWVSNDFQRHEEYLKMIKNDNREDTLRVAVAISKNREERLKNGKKVLLSDERMFKEAIGNFAGEAAIALGISAQEAEELIKEKISKNL